MQISNPLVVKNSLRVALDYSHLKKKVYIRWLWPRIVQWRCTYPKNKKPKITRKKFKRRWKLTSNNENQSTPSWALIPVLLAWPVYQCCLHEFRVTTGNRYMRFYVNPSNLLFFIARLSTSTNTTEEFKGYLNYVVNDDRCNHISNFPRKPFQEIYPLLHHLKCFLVTARYVLEGASMENLERCW